MSRGTKQENRKQLHATIILQEIENEAVRHEDANEKTNKTILRHEETNGLPSQLELSRLTRTLAPTHTH